MRPTADGLSRQHSRQRVRAGQRVIELNARTVAAAAISLSIPVVLSTAGVGMGLNGPTVASLQAALPNATAIDRTTTNA